MPPRGRKASAVTIDERLDTIQAALGTFESPASIGRRLTVLWGVDPRTVDRYIEQVRTRQREHKLATLTTEERAQRQNQVIAGIEQTVRLALDHKGKGGTISLGGLQRAQKGLEMLGQIYGCFKQDVDITSGGQPLHQSGASGLREMLERLLREAKAKKDREAKKPTDEGATP